jgi:glycosyltransferase involved in cell wall biosynthesis
MRVSVVMPARNAAPYLDAAIRSIHEQTLRDFELVILDDASTDDSPTILARWAERDPRIRLHRTERPLGMVGAANRVVALASAPLIARMDADDVAHPDRLARQIEVLEKRPDVVLVGTLADGIDAGGHRVRPRDAWRLVRRSHYAPFPHGSATFRREPFERIGGYREHNGWEDQDLFRRLGEVGTIAVLPDVLYHYRYHADCASAQARANGTIRAGAAIRLWAGDRVEALPLYADVPFATRTWMTWARRHPASLRFVMRCLIRARDLAARAIVRNGRVYSWRYA